MDKNFQMKRDQLKDTWSGDVIHAENGLENQKAGIETSTRSTRQTNDALCTGIQWSQPMKTVRPS